MASRKLPANMSPNTRTSTPPQTKRLQTSNPHEDNSVPSSILPLGGEAHGSPALTTTKVANPSAHVTPRETRNKDSHPERGMMGREQEWPSATAKSKSAPMAGGRGSCRVV